MAEPKAVEQETPEPERLAVGIESLLHDWRGAYERARAYLAALGLGAADVAVRAVAESATAARWREGTTAHQQTLSTLRKLVAGRDRARGDEEPRAFLEWRWRRVFGPDGTWPAPTPPLTRGVITVGSGQEIGDELIGQHVVKNTITGGWRLGFQIRPKDNTPIDLRGYLQKGDETLTETWSYTLRP